MLHKTFRTYESSGLFMFRRFAASSIQWANGVSTSLNLRIKKKRKEKTTKKEWEKGNLKKINYKKKVTNITIYQW